MTNSCRSVNLLKMTVTESFEFWQFCDWIILKWLIKLICRFYLISELKFQQELSYRKQIVRQLCTQFLEGISVTVKSTLRVTQCHWKRNHWIDHIRLSISRVLWHWILLWPWNVGQRWFTVIEISAIRSLGTVSYSPSIVTVAVSLAVCEIFSVK